MWWYEGGWRWDPGRAMTLRMPALWALVISPILALVRAGVGGALRRKRTSKEPLAERFARGEIDEDGQRQRLEALRSSRSIRTAGSGGRS